MEVLNLVALLLPRSLSRSTCKVMVSDRRIPETEGDEFLPTFLLVAGEPVSINPGGSLYPPSPPIVLLRVIDEPSSASPLALPNGLA